MELVIVVGLVAVVAVAGALWKRGQGRVVAVSGHTISQDYRTPGKTMLLQFTTELCSPCAQLKPRLEKIANFRSDVEYRELDAVEHLDLANSLGIRSTPTTLVVSPNGIITSRITGVAVAEVFINAIDGKSSTTHEEITI
jgi:thiol-disulfide isomerase/thioredoxin